MKTFLAAAILATGLGIISLPIGIVGGIWDIPFLIQHIESNGVAVPSILCLNLLLVGSVVTTVGFFALVVISDASDGDTDDSSPRPRKALPQPKDGLGLFLMRKILLY